MTDSDKELKREQEYLARMDQAGSRKPYASPMLVKRDKLGQITAKPATSGITIKSSRALKTIEGKIDAAGILAGLTSLSIEAWRYRPESGLEQQTHIGPYAEDFQATFGVGDGVTISTIDAIGVCLAAIKALSEKVETLEAALRLATRKPYVGPTLAKRDKLARIAAAGDTKTSGISDGIR
jgi:hypothetical protein